MADYRAGIIAATVVNTVQAFAGKKGGKTIGPEDFFPSLSTAKPAASGIQSPEAQLAFVQMFHEAYTHAASRTPGMMADDGGR